MTVEYSTVICSTVPCVLSWMDAHATAIVAIVAIVFTIWQITVARRHNKLSVRPRLFFVVEQEGTPDDDICFRFILHNLGLGPAYITAVEYRVNRRVFVAHDPAEMQNALQEIFPNRATNGNVLFRFFQMYAVAKDDSLALVEIEALKKKYLGYDPTDKLREALSICVQYKTPYNERKICEWPERPDAGFWGRLMPRQKGA